LIYGTRKWDSKEAKNEVFGRNEKCPKKRSFDGTALTYEIAKKKYIGLPIF